MNPVSPKLTHVPLGCSTDRSYSGVQEKMHRPLSYGDRNSSSANGECQRGGGARQRAYLGEQRTGRARRSRSRREAAPKAVAIEESRHRRPMPCLPNSAPWSQQGQNAHISDASPAYSSIHEAASSGQMAWNKRMGGSN